MRPDSRRKPTPDGPGPVRLAAPHPPDPPFRGPGPIDPPADPRPEARPQGGSPRGRTLPAGIEPLLHIDDLAALLSCSRRGVERMRAAGKLPRPDIHVGKCPRWKPATIRAWIERGGKT